MILLSYIKLLRPHQWFKNLLLLFPPFFAGKIFDPSVLESIVPALLSFSFAASCSYIVNDIMDKKGDRSHGVKKNRAIARGDILVPIAYLIAVSLYITAMAMASSVSSLYIKFQWFLILYLLVSFLYTFLLKNIVIVDIYFIAFGFVIRVLAGGAAFRIDVTNWLFLTVFIVSLLLAAGKRLGELISLGDDAHNHRKSLAHYSSSFLEGMIWFSASAALVTYALYTIEHGKGMFYTVPLAAFGLMRYIYIVKQGKGDPTDALLQDGQIMGTAIIWILMNGAFIYIR